MAFLPTSDLNVNTILQNVGILYNDPNAIYQQIAPVITCDQTGEYFEFDAKAEAFRDERDSHKLGASDTPGIRKFKYTKLPYSIEGYGLGSEISEKEYVNAQRLGLDIEGDTVTSLLQVLNQDLNNDLYTLLTTTANWTSTNAATGLWTADAGDPEADFDLAKETIAKNSNGARMPNTMIMGLKAKNALFRNAKVRNIVKYVINNSNGPKGALWTGMQDLFGIENIFVLPNVKNTAAKGATKSMSEIWGSTVWVGYLEPTPGKMKPSAFYALSMAGLGANNPFGIRVWSMKKMGTSSFEDGFQGVRIWVTVNTAFKKIAADLGYTITGVIS